MCQAKFRVHMALLNFERQIAGSFIILNFPNASYYSRYETLFFFLGSLLLRTTTSGFLFDLVKFKQQLRFSHLPSHKFDSVLKHPSCVHRTAQVIFQLWFSELTFFFIINAFGSDLTSRDATAWGSCPAFLNPAVRARLVRINRVK